MRKLDKEEQEIIDGWAELAEEYEPRSLNAKELAQVQQAELEEEIAKKTPFVLGEPL
jgi:hypothetical protein